MVCTVDKIAQIMDEIAPEIWAESWDNVGLLLGNRESEVSRLMVVLDISPSVVKEAINKEVDMIISHHPLIFSPLKAIRGDSVEGGLIIPLISNNIAVYCAHTNLDMARGGVDDTLAKVLGLKDVQLLNPIHQSPMQKPGFGRWGKLDPPVTIEEFTRFVGKTLNVPTIDIISHGSDNFQKIINTVALCAGSGADFMMQAKKVKADLFVTGEIKYHDALNARWSGIDIMAIGHFYSEAPAMKELISRLQTVVDSLQYEVDILESETQASPYYRVKID